MKAEMDFNSLITAIREVHAELAAQAGREVNISLTLRNWLIGYYIAEYKMNGADRAEYGEKLLEKLSKELEASCVGACGKRQLYNYLSFYQLYPEIVRSLPAQFQQILPEGLLTNPEIVRSATAQSKRHTQQLITTLSYTHIQQLTPIVNTTQRAFYEIECIGEIGLFES